VGSGQCTAATAGGFLLGYVAIMSHGLTALVRNSLKQEGNDCDTERHELDGSKSKKCLILLAIPAGKQPAKDFNGVDTFIWSKTRIEVKSEICAVSNRHCA
jgi:hypothetical protein